MSYSGTTRCSHCYRRGHNKSGCPDLIKLHEEYKQRFAKYKEENPDCPDYCLTDVPWSIRREMDLSWLHVTAAEVMSKKAKKNINRQCTYCYGKGHNRRTCEPLKGHLDLLVKAQLAYNEKIAKSLTAAGYGVGALFQQKGERWDSSSGTYVEYNEMGVITDFNLNYCIIEYLRSTYQRQPTIGAHLGGKRMRLMPYFNEQVKRELSIGTAWQSSPDHILLSRSHTPVPPPAHTEKGIRNSIKEDLKDWNLASVKAWFHRLEGIVEVPSENR